MTTRIVLDGEGLHALARPVLPRELTLLLEVAQRAGLVRLVTPSAVLVEAMTGDDRDASLFRALSEVDVEDVLDVGHARNAAGLRRDTDASAVDAIVAELAIRRRATAIVTSDPDDLTALLANGGQRIELVVV